MPAVVARVGVDLDPVDVTDADDARWLRACLWPDQPERVARLEAEMALAATAPPLLLQGDAVEVVPDAFARVPADAGPEKFGGDSLAETLHNVAAQRYRLLRLERRAAQAQPPVLKLIDLRASSLRAGISTPAVLAIERHLSEGGQVLVFLNRRGYAPTLLCTACGWIAPASSRRWPNAASCPGTS